MGDNKLFSKTNIHRNLKNFQVQIQVKVDYFKARDFEV